MADAETNGGCVSLYYYISRCLSRACHNNDSNGKGQQMP